MNSHETMTFLGVSFEPGREARHQSIVYHRSFLLTVYNFPNQSVTGCSCYHGSQLGPQCTIYRLCGVPWISIWMLEVSHPWRHAPPWRPSPFSGRTGRTATSGTTGITGP